MVGDAKIVCEPIHGFTKEQLDEKSHQMYKDQVDALMLIIKKCRRVLVYDVCIDVHMDAINDCEKAILNYDGVPIDAEMRERMKEWQEGR